MGQSATYSFLDASLAISGPGGNFTIGGSGAATAEEGITIEMEEDKTTLNIGADGTPMHSLHAGTPSTWTLRVQKTAAVNNQLSVMYDFQRLSSSNWGQNTLIMRNVATGDIITGQAAAFKRFTPLTFAKEGGMNEWTFSVGQTDQILGTGTPAQIALQTPAV